MARVAALGAAGLLALAGCNGANADPTPSSGAASSASQTPSSSPTSPSTTTATSPSGTATVTVPPAARAHTNEGAKAFARFFVDTMNEAQVRADAAKLQAISDDGCKGCKAYIDLARDLRDKKQHADVASLRVESIGLRPDSTLSQMHLDLLIDEAPSKTVDSKGRVVETFDGGRMTIRATLRWANDSWRVEQALLVTA